MIDITDRESIRSMGPVLIAHRGGVVAPGSPECSLRAIQLAREQGYQMVELDVQCSLDGVPVVFHGLDLGGSVGAKNHVPELTVDDLRKIRLRESDEHIATLEEAFGFCRELELGVMLEIKPMPPVLPEEHFVKIAELVERYGLSKAAICFTPYPFALRHLSDRCLFTPSGEEIERCEKGERLDLRRKFLFFRPDDVSPHTVATAQQNGALAIVAINEFFYPADVRATKPRQDVERWRDAGVDGFQIDSIYRGLFPGDKQKEETQ